MKKFLLLLLLPVMFCSCAMLQSAADKVPDPNDIGAIGAGVSGIGIQIGRPEVAGIGMVIVGIAAVLKALRRK